MLRRPFEQHGIGECLDDANRVDPPRDSDRQTFAGELVDQRHQPQSPTIVRSAFDKVEAPDMIAMLRPQPDAGSIVEPEPTPRLLLPGYF